MYINLPSTSACYGRITAARTPEEIIRHALRVNQVAVFLAEALALKGKRVNVDLVDRATLLHNHLKHAETTTQRHVELAARALEHEYPELASVIRAHAVEAILDSARAPKTLEQKIVYYADRRVTGSTIVPLETKLYRQLAKQLLRGRQTNAPELLVPLARLEQQLFSPLDIAPLDLQRLQDLRMNHDPRHLLLHVDE